MPTHFKSGTWNCICDVCGGEFKSDQLRKRWDGLMVCDSDYEVRHPMDFMRVSSHETSVPWTRPEPADSFIPMNWGTVQNDLIDFLEFVDTTASYTRSFSDTLSLADVLSSAVDRPVSDAIAVADSVAKAVGTITYDNIPLTDYNIEGVDSLMGDPISIAESVTPITNYIRGNADTVSISESITAQIIIANPLNYNPLNSRPFG